MIRQDFSRVENDGPTILMAMADPAKLNIRCGLCICYAIQGLRWTEN